MIDRYTSHAAVLRRGFFLGENVSMKLPSFGLLLSVVILLGGFCGGQTQAKPSATAENASAKDPFDSFKTFSATLNGGAGGDHDRKIYRSGNLMRSDFGDSYRITDLEKRITWGVDPHSCTRVSAADAASFPFSAYRGFKVERSLASEKEAVDGHSCVIENVTFTPTDGRPLVVTMKLWEAEDLQHFPIKVQIEPTGPMIKDPAKINITYTSVNLEPPDGKLFKHPSDCAEPARQSGSPKAAPKSPPKPSQTPQP
jgi:hypothetical protein